MEVIVAFEPRVNEAEEMYTVLIDINGNEYRTPEIIPGFRNKMYRIINDALKFEDMAYYGQCNIVIPDDDGLDHEYYRNVLRLPTSGRWVLVTDEELSNLFEEI